MKVYNEKEIGSILTRATELSKDDAQSSSMGLSLIELEQLGREAGINPDLIRKAASEMGASKERNQNNSIFGGPVSYSNQLVLDFEITPEEWEEMLLEIRTAFQEPGSVSTRENIYEWTIQGAALKAQFTARIDNGRTKINVFRAEPAAPIPFFIPSIIGTIISLPITFEALNLSGFPGAAVILSTFMSLFLLGRWGVSSYAERYAQKMDRMMTAIEMLGNNRQRSQSTSPSEHLPESHKTKRHIQLDDIEAEEYQEQTRFRGRDQA